jgi:hypothetical protein
MLEEFLIYLGFFGIGLISGITLNYYTQKRLFIKIGEYEAWRRANHGADTE